MPLAAVAAGKGRSSPTPGWNRLTNRRPSESETVLAERGRIPHVGDAGDERPEDQRSDDHLDQAQKKIGQDRKAARDCCQSSRIGYALV
jgi:hypothetical protein